jgi:hypothetical protein
MDRLPATEPITDIIQDTFFKKKITGFSSNEVDSHPQLDTPLERETGAETKGADTRTETQRAEEQGPRLYSFSSGSDPERRLFGPIEVMDPESWDHYFPLWKLNGIPHADQEARERPFPCPQCGKRYKTRKYLTEHIRGVHVREVRFACGIWGKGFFQARQKFPNFRYR